MEGFIDHIRSVLRRKLKSATNGITYLIVLALGVAARALSRDQAKRLASFMGDFMHHALGIRRRMVYENLGLTFPEKSAAEIASIAEKVYRNVAMTLMEVLRFPLIRNRADAAALADVDAVEFLRKTRNMNKGAVFVSAHYGNWELMALTFGLLVTPVSIVVKRLRNTPLDFRMNRWRTMGGNSIIYKRNALRDGLKTLASGGVLAILGDQSDPKGGNFGEFLGRRTTMFHGAAFFALKAHVPLFVCMCQRKGDGRYNLEYEEVDTSDLTFCREDIATLASRYTRVIESYIRQWPEEWFWLHDRWKRS